MENKEVFLKLYRSKPYPQEFEGYLFPIFELIISNLSERLQLYPQLNKQINLSICLQYLVEEHLYNMSMMNEEFINKFMDSSDYTNHLFMIVCDKIFFNEYLEYKATVNITKYSPLISSLTLFLNFILNKYEQIPKQVNDLNIALKLDILKKGFFMIKSILNLLSDGFETEAFSTWRTLHEIECVALTLDKHQNTAIRIMTYHYQFDMNPS